MIEQEAEGVVHWSGIDEVVVVQDEDEWVGDAGGDIVEHGGENRLGRRRLRGLERAHHPFAKSGRDGLQRGDEVRQKAGGVVVPRVQRQPCGWTGTPCQPLADQGGFPKAGRGRGEREGARQALLESLNKVDTGHQLRPRTGLVQLGREQRCEQLTARVSWGWSNQSQQRVGFPSLFGRGELTRLAPRRGWQGCWRASSRGARRL